MADVFKTIFEADAQFQQVLTGLDAINKKYGQSVLVMNQQEAEVSSLIAKEKQLLDARTKAQNPNTAVRLTKELENVRTKIAAVNAQLKSTTKANEGLLTSSKHVTAQLQKAFGTSMFNSAKNQIQGIEAAQKKVATGFVSVSSGANNFLKETLLLKQEMQKAAEEGQHGFEKYGNIVRGANGEIIASRANLITLKKALANATDPAEVAHLAEEVGHLKHELDLASEAAVAFSSGNKFKATGIVFEEIAHDIASFNFAGAEQKATLLGEIAKKITFGDAVKGVKQLGNTLFEVGKALLTNPLVLLAGAIFAAFEAFESFNESAERTEEVMKGIDEAIKQIIEDTEALARANRDLALQLEIDAKKISAVNGEKLKAQNKYKDEYLAIVKRTQEAQNKINEEANKAREEDGFRATKKIFEALGGETELTKVQKEGLIEIQKKHNEEIEELNKHLTLETQKVLQDDARERQKKQKEAADKYRKILEDEFNLRKDFNKRILEADRENTNFNIKEREKNGGRAQLIAEFEAKKALAHEESDAQREELLKQIDNARKEGLLTTALKKKFSQDAILIVKAEAQEIINLNQEKDLALIENDTKQRQESIDRVKTNSEELLRTTEDTEIGIARQKLLIQQDYYAKSIALAEDDIQKRKAKAFDVTDQEKALADLKIKANAENIASLNELNRLETDGAIKQTDLLESQGETQDKLQNHRNSTLLVGQLNFEKAKLEILKQGGKDYIDEAKRQADKVALLEKEATKERRLEAIGYYEEISAAAIAATQKFISIKEQEVEKQTSLQEKRVEQAKNIADKGNAEQLEAEEKRLDDLNKKREKFVRAQQQLATVELISNTAITVSKAAAQGGVAAGVTIAAALVALVAGLASARAIASQAAFYQGGEFSGFTGQGNPAQESKAVGAKPYVYHKREFIFNHQTTDKNLDVFRRIHGGQVNLKEWESKVNAYDSIKNRVNERADLFMNPIAIKQSDEYKALENKVDQLIGAIQGQDRLKVTLTDKGVHAVVSSYEARQNLIKELAGGV